MGGKQEKIVTKILEGGTILSHAVHTRKKGVRQRWHTPFFG